MKEPWAQIQTLSRSVVEKVMGHKGMMTVFTVTGLAVLLAFPFYFVRELLAAELLFAIAFAVLLVLGGLAYLVGSIGERGLEFAEAGIRMIGDSARRGFSNLEDINRKPSRL
jgi:hypothetical protein